jgi:hypothetical protein
MAFVWVSLLAAVTLGCSDDDAVRPVNADVNPIKPNSNQRIVDQTMPGALDSQTSLRILKPDGSGGFHFVGLLDSQSGAGRLDASGELSWFEGTDYATRDIHVLSQNQPMSGHALVVGAWDIDVDGESEVGYVSLIGSRGVIDEVSYNSDSSDVWLNSVVPISDATFVVVGGERTRERQNPFVARIVITPQGKIVKQDQLVLLSIAGRYFDNVVTEYPSLSPGNSDLVFYALSDDGRRGSPIIPTVSVHKVRAALSDLSSTVEWSVNLSFKPPLGTYAGTGDHMALLADGLYIVGDADSEKKPSPPDGGLWKDGLTASVSLAGDLRWLHRVQLTSYNDQFFGAYVTPAAFYAVGASAAFNQSGRMFGYGSLSKFALTDGEASWNMTFGDHAYASGYSGVFVSGGTACCAGWTHWDEEEGRFVGWFAQIDMGNAGVQDVPHLQEAINTRAWVESSAPPQTTTKPFSYGDR